MTRVTSTVQTSATPDAVWLVASDPQNLASWLANHVGFPAGPPASLDTGSAYSQQVRVMGMPQEVAWSVTESAAPADGPGRIAWEGQAPMGIGVNSALSIEAAGAGSALSFSQEFSGAPVMMFAAALEGELPGVLAESLDMLRGLAEG